MAVLPIGSIPAVAATEDVGINEMQISTSGTDWEFVELAGPVGEDLSSLTLIGIESDADTTPGSIDVVLSLAGHSIGSSGYWTAISPTGASTYGVTGDMSIADNTFENSTQTYFLVTGFSGSQGDDVDGDDDGVLDTTVPWTSVIDGVNIIDADPGDFTYGAESVGPDGTFLPSGTYRCPDTTGTFTGNILNFSTPNGTPGAANDCPFVAPDISLNEIRIDQPGSDNDEFFELAGSPGASLDGLTYLVIGDGTAGSGVIENVTPLSGLMPSTGYFVAAESTFSGTADLVTTLNFENSDNVTHLLVAGFTGANGNDLDTDDDGTLDTEPWDAIVDSVALIETVGSADLVYSTTTVGPDGTFVPGHVYLCGEWLIGDFGGADTTPGEGNLCEYKIWEVQGDGDASPLVGDPVIIEGIVVGDYQNNGHPDNGNLNGFHLQEENADSDLDASTSDGIFVSDGGFGVDVSIGDKVSVTGTVTEFFGLTEITNVVAVNVTATGQLAPTPATVLLPAAGSDDFEKYEGMSVVLPQALTISEYFNFDRYGEIVLTLGRTPQPTAQFEPGSPEAAALAAANRLARITLDDGRTSENPVPALHPNGAVFDLTNRFRGGDTVQDLAGVMDFSFGAYKIQPTTGGTYTALNPRPASPDDVGGGITVATFNVLNYFTTLDTGAPICGPEGDQGCRGANNATELERQRTKIIEAIAAMDADVVGLMEIENHPADVPLADLVAGLNDLLGAGTYDYIASGPVGPDAIRVAVIYQPATVSPHGTHAVLDDLGFLDPNNTGSDRNRAVLAQSFVDDGNGAVFTVAVNHLKSKGSSCGTGDDDAEQGNCNLTRTLAAEVLTDWLQTDPTGSGDEDFFIIGDLNSYDKEDPIDAFKAAGYSDLILDFVGEDAYTYVFSGQWGYLDYVMSNETATAQVTGATVWHINADEPDILDYDTNFNPVEMYEPNAYRSSDHDPVIVGLDLVATPAQAKRHAIDALTSVLPTGKAKDDRSIRKAIASIEDSLNPQYWVDDSHLTDQGNKVFDEEKKAVQDLIKVSDPGLVEAPIEALVEADAVLAATAIDDAIAVAGDPRYLDRANQQMTAAAELVAAGDFDQAIDRYKKAWMDAQEAIAGAPVRFATFNASLNRSSAGDLVAELSTPGSDQPNTIAEIIQRNRPDVLLINEFDYDSDGLAAMHFQDNYLAVPQNGADPIVYPYRFVAPSNTGVPSGFDLNNNGSVGGPDDAFGFGFHEGQFGMVVYSMYPIDTEKVRTFQNFLWKDMPGALLPDDLTTPEPSDWYSADELEVVRLSSKSHWDIPIKIGSDKVHFLASHPTPPVFDGDEDRNGKRNHDEIRFWADYIDDAGYIYDDSGVSGGLNAGAKFVIAGDQNSDPFDGDSVPGSAQLLLEHPRINAAMTPSSAGGVEQSALQGQANNTHSGDPAFDTADFNSASPGNLRVDYVLPRFDMEIVASGVFWPLETDPLFRLVGTFPFPSSDHRLVWIDIDLR